MNFGITNRGVTDLLEEYADIPTVEEVCEVLRSGENAAYALLGSGQLKGFRNGRRWRIPREAARRFILKRAGLH